MAPQSDYGNHRGRRVPADGRTARIRRVVVIARYAPGQPQDAAQQIAAVSGQIDALFIPEQADGMPAVAAALAASGIKTQLLGTGVWNDAARAAAARSFRAPGSSAPDNAGFNAFSQRYKAKFNSEPTRLATLSYDAVTLAGALARNPDRVQREGA